MENINIGDYVRYETRNGTEIHRVERIIGGVSILDNGYVCTEDSVEVISKGDAFNTEFQNLLAKYKAKISNGSIVVRFSEEKDDWIGIGEAASY